MPKSKARRVARWLKIFYFLLGIAIIALAWWQWPAITAAFNNFIIGVWTTLGFGLFLILAYIAALVIAIAQGKFTARHILYWLGGIFFLLAAWGILAFFQGEGALARVYMGGNIGLGIIGDPVRNFVGILTGIFRIIGLVFIGAILMAPGGAFNIVKNFFSWLIEKLKKQPAPDLAPSQPQMRMEEDETYAMPLSRTMGAPVRPKEQPEKQTFHPFNWPGRRTERTAPPVPGRLHNEWIAKELSGSGSAPAKPPTPAPAPAPMPAKAEGSGPKELKQVAQDVWKKYGESPDLVTINGWKLPPIDILDKSPEIQFSQADNAKRAKLIEEALHSYGVDAKVVQVNEGPTVTQFGVEPGWDVKTKDVREKDKDGNVRIKTEETSKTRVKVDRITSLGNDLALALAAPSIRIEAPVPGKSIIGVEVPNTKSTVVSLRGVIETSPFQKILSKSKMAIALGKGAGGEAIAGDLAKMPHLLIAGSTGSGKTVCLNSIICGLLLNNTPNDVRFVLVDPKRVELTMFNSIPHLATPVIVESEKALDALRWLSQEMNKRYQTLATVGARNIEGYNKNKQGDEKMPYLVLVIDELADLMMATGDEVERILCRLAQLARAIGIHLVVATQRPSVDVITGLIKANFPTRISFAVTSQVDSRTILDMVGAEKLLGSGDMLYMPTEAGKPTRLQGCYVSDAEAERLVYFWGNQHKEGVTSLKLEDLALAKTPGQKAEIPSDTLLETARQLAKEHPQISASYLQRKLRIGYPRAARLMEELEQEQAKDNPQEKPT